VNLTCHVPFVHLIGKDFNILSERSVSVFTLRRTGGASIAVRKVNLPEAQIVNMG